MHVDTILHHCLEPLLHHLHRWRQATLLAAVASCLSGPRLCLTDLGRRLAGEARLRHKIKRSDRLLGNRHLQQEAGSIYAARCRVTLARIREPLILIDWSDLKADQSLHLLRASLPVGGRSLTLYEEVHPQKQLGNRVVQQRFLGRLAQLLPASVAPIIIADAGFKVPFYQEVERLGWRWVGRVRGRDYVRLNQRWVSCQTLFKSENGQRRAKLFPRHCRLGHRPGHHGLPTLRLSHAFRQGLPGDALVAGRGSIQPEGGSHQ